MDGDNDDDETNLNILGLSNITEFQTQLQEEFNEMIESVDTYGGFYIGRYETGNLKTDTNVEPVVVKGNEDIGGGDQTWYYMYQNSKKVAARDNVVSTMIWGCMWDRTLIWLTETENKTYEELKDSRTWGNYRDSIGDAEENSGEMRPTGYSEFWKANNIYDLAGNIRDWTLEAYSRYSRPARGGYGTFVYSENNSGAYDSASNRYNYSPENEYGATGMRLALYVSVNVN